MKVISASVMFGLVNIPVGVTGVTKTAGETRFRNLHKKCNTPVSNKVWCNTCGVEADETVKGVKVNSKLYAPVADEQLQEVKAERTNVITITKFVTDTAVDAEQFNKHYWLVPDDKITDGYFLLTEGLVRKDMVGVGTTALWGKEHPCLVRAHSGGLMLSLLHVTEDMVERPFDPPALVTTKAAHKSMLDLACDLIERQAGILKPEDITSESRAAREAMVDQILNKVETPQPSFDLMAALRLSVTGKKKVKT